MKRCVFVAVLMVFLAGCGESQKRSAFKIQDLKLGMQKYEVQVICNGSLEFVASEVIPNQKGSSMVVYRMWPNETKNLLGQRICDGSPAANLWARNKDIKPYLLTFIEHPPLTKANAIKLAKDVNATNPDDVKIIVGLFEGYCPAQLVGVSQDTETIRLRTIQAIQRQQELYNANQGSVSQTTSSYGSGVYMNRYGQPVTLRPDFGSVQGELLKIKPDVYGPGIHSDQYGRPVREYPLP
jgi:hypothetical protein